MSEKPEDNFDKLFRQSADNFDIPFNEKDWIKMELMLDQLPDAKPAFSFRKKLLVGAGLLFLSTLTFFIGLKTNDLKPVKNTSELSIKFGKIEESSDEKPDTLGFYSKNIFKMANQAQHILKRKIEAEKKEEKDLVNNMAEIYGDNGAKNKESGFEEEMVPEMKNQDIGEGENEIIEVKNDYSPLQVMMKKEKHFIQNADTSSNEKIKLNIIPDSSNVEERDFTRKQGKSLLSRISVQASFSPDFSSTEMLRIEKPGSIIGAAINFRINNRFQIQAGLAKSRKIYTAKGSEYKPDVDIWNYGSYPEYAEGECAVLEVPLNVQYNITKGAKFRVFISSGISSYFMLSEYYRFTYKNYDYDQIQDYSAENSGSHLFQVVNVSIGGEYLISKKLAVQLEPFWKSSLMGIGYGNVSLLTRGINMSLVLKPFEK